MEQLSLSEDQPGAPLQLPLSAENVAEVQGQRVKHLHDCAQVVAGSLWIVIFFSKEDTSR
jgi:hypothetical protein